MLWVILKRYRFSQLPPGGKKWLRPQEWSLVSTPETWPLPATPYTTALTAHCSGISLSFYGKPRRETRAPSYEAVERVNMKSVYAQVLSKSLAHSRHPRSTPELRQELSTISQVFSHLSKSNNQVSIICLALYKSQMVKQWIKVSAFILGGRQRIYK